MCTCKYNNLISYKFYKLSRKIINIINKSIIVPSNINAKYITVYMLIVYEDYCIVGFIGGEFNLVY